MFVRKKFQHAARQFITFLSLHFLLAQHIKVSQSWALNAFSGLPWACTRSKHAHRFPGIHQSFLKPQMDISCPFLLSFLTNLLFALPVTYCLRLTWCSTIATDCFQQMLPGKRLFTLGQLQVRYSKDSLVSGVFLRITRQIKSNFLGMGLWRSSNSFLPHSVPSRILLVSTVLAGCWFLRLAWSWGWEDRNRTT